jgi:hypothetical protein
VHVVERSPGQRRVLRRRLQDDARAIPPACRSSLAATVSAAVRDRCAILSSCCCRRQNVSSTSTCQQNTSYPSSVGFSTSRSLPRSNRFVSAKARERRPPPVWTCCTRPASAASERSRLTVSPPRPGMTDLAASGQSASGGRSVPGARSGDLTSKSVGGLSGSGESSPSDHSHLASLARARCSVVVVGPQPASRLSRSTGGRPSGLDTASARHLHAGSALARPRSTSKAILEPRRLVTYAEADTAWVGNA